MSRRMHRRDFLRLAVAGTGLALIPRSSRAADAHIEVLLDEPIAPITPQPLRPFRRAPRRRRLRRHLGRRGIEDRQHRRHSARARRCHAALAAGPIRWPGGCFADSYDWRDGVGPRSSRPRRTNFWANDMATLPDGPAKYEPNQFGTNDFVRFCRLAGGEPYLAANLRSLPARDFYQWVEFCNSPAGSSTLADLRASAGDRDPFRVRFWGVGNESWGCGGNFTPEEYATEFRRFTAWLPRYGVDLALIASGPNSGDLSLDASLPEQADRKG